MDKCGIIRTYVEKYGVVWTGQMRTFLAIINSNIDHYFESKLESLLDGVWISFNRLNFELMSHFSKNPFGMRTMWYMSSFVDKFR